MKCEWKKVPIKDLCIGIYDGPHATPPKSDSGAVFLGIPNFSNGRLDLSNIRYISESDLPRWTKRVTPKAHDIVFSYEATLNLYAIIPEGFYGCLGRRMALMRPDESKVDYRFLYYYMFSAEWREEIERHKVNGSTVDRIPLVSFPSFTVNLPNMATQRYIADILSALDDKIEINNKINANLQQQADLLYNELFENELEFCELGSVIETTSGGTPSRKQLQFYENASILWMKSKELTGGFIYDTEEKINQIALAKTAVKLLPPHSILVAMYGATVGECGIVSSSMTCNQAICALLPNDKYPYTYLYQLIRHTKEQLKNMAVGSAQQNISQVLIKKMPIHSNQKNVKQFHVKAQPYFKMMELLTLENIKLVELRNTLIPKLMSDTINLDVNFYN